MPVNYSLLFLTYNRRGIVARCFRSMASTLHRDDVEWRILDNGSTDGTADWLLKLAARYPNVHVELHALNTGVAGGRDRLFRQAQGKVIISLDSDVEARSPLWLERLTAPLRDHDEVWVAGPGGCWVKPHWLGYDAAPADYAGPVDVVSGFCQAWKRTAFERGVAMDLKFNLRWHEDSDAALQAQALGGQVWHTGDIGLFHVFSLTGDTGDSAVKQMYLASKWRGKGLIKAERERMA